MALHLLLDENVSRHVEARLRLDGHQLTLARDVALGRPDADVLAIAHRLSAIVLTEDTDFGDLVWRQRLPSAGIILLRLSGLARTLQPDYVANMLSTHAASLPGMFTVITPTGIRHRALP
jgi:predicted nuclease of predicted toxin-antitoxin system